MMIAILNNKGGVGKTTTAVNLAAGLAESGCETLLVDLDGQASASFHLGLSRQDLSPSIAEVLLDALEVGQAIRQTSAARLHLLSGAPRLANFDLNLASGMQRESRLKKALAPLRSRFEYIVLDCPPALSLMTVNALHAADHFLVPVAPGYLALEGLAGLLQAVEETQRQSSVGCHLLGILPAMVDRRTRLTSEVLTVLRQHFGKTVLDTEIRVNVRLAEASSFGQSVFDYSPCCKGALNYESLVEEIKTRCQEHSKAA